MLSPNEALVLDMLRYVVGRPPLMKDAVVRLADAGGLDPPHADALLEGMRLAGEGALLIREVVDGLLGPATEEA